MSKLSEFRHVKLSLEGGAWEDSNGLIAMPQPTNPHDHDNDHEISIETLSTPPLKIPPAPLSNRLLAGVIDSIIISLAWFALISAQHATTSLFPVQLTLSDAYLWAIAFVYYFLQEGLFASTIGKTLMKLRVVEKTGDPCSFAGSFKRNILRFIDWLPALYILAAVVISVSKEKQRLGDIVAKTIVTPIPAKDINPPPAPFLFH